MTYSNEDIQGFHEKDKRISWLSIFSSLCSQTGNEPKQLAEVAYVLNDALYQKYPFPTDNVPVARTTTSIGGMKCPKCGADMKMREKEGSKFWGCPNYRTKGCKTLPYNEAEPY